jgi:transposase
MKTAVTIGLDIAKNVFQAHGVDAEEAVTFRKRLTRAKVVEFFAGLPPCLVGIEACATAHHWARTLRDLGHAVKLMPPAYVKPYVKSQKNDAADAEAICEAVTRPTMRFAEVKSVEQQSVLSMHRLRTLLIRHRTRLANTIRAHMAEFGVVAPIGRMGLERLIHIICDENDDQLTPMVRRALGHLVNQHDQQVMQILDLDRQILAWHRSNEVSRRLATIPGIGPLAASALAATIGDANIFRSGRALSAWLGLVPRQNSSGGKERLGGISKRGDGYLRNLLVVGSLSVIKYAQRHGTKRPWLVKLLERRTSKIAAVAMANKIARMVWAIMTRGERYREPLLRAA